MILGGHKKWAQETILGELDPRKLLKELAPQVGLEPTTLRLTENEFAAPPAAIDCYKPLYDMHLSPQSHSADCYPLGSITIDFEGAWAQKWAQRNSRVASLSRRESAQDCGTLRDPRSCHP